MPAATYIIEDRAAGLMKKTGYVKQENEEKNGEIKAKRQRGEQGKKGSSELSF